MAGSSVLPILEWHFCAFLLFSQTIRVGSASVLNQELEMKMFMKFTNVFDWGQRVYLCYLSRGTAQTCVQSSCVSCVCRELSTVL